MCREGDPAYCYKNLRPWITNYWITQNSSFIYFEFNTTVKLATHWEQGISWDLKLEGPLDEYKYSWTVVNATEHKKVPTSGFFIYIDYPDQLFDYDFENITLYFNDSSAVIDSTNEFEMVDQAIQFYLHGKERDVPIEDWIGISLFAVGYATLIGFTVGLILLGFPGWTMIDIICALQLVHLIPVARLYIPTVLLRFFQIFKYCNFEHIAFGQWKFTRAIDSDGFTKNDSPINYNFLKMGYDSKAFFSLTIDVWFFMTMA